MAEEPPATLVYSQCKQKGLWRQLPRDYASKDLPRTSESNLLSKTKPHGVTDSWRDASLNLRTRDTCRHLLKTKSPKCCSKLNCKIQSSSQYSLHLFDWLSVVGHDMGIRYNHSHKVDVRLHMYIYKHWWPYRHTNTQCAGASACVCKDIRLMI